MAEERDDVAAVAGLVLAAGGGSRFGGPKAFVELDGRPLVTHAADYLRAAGCTPVVAVLGAGAHAGGALPRDVEIVVNADWASGAATSLQAGLDRLRGRARAVVIALADQPAIAPQAVRRVRAAWEEGADAVVAVWDGQPGHPVVLDAGVWDDVQAMAAGDVGARAFLRAHPERVVTVACDGLGDPTDIDTPQDMDTLRN